MGVIKFQSGRETITTKIAYLAGFFDGEGCIRIKKASQGGNSYYLWVAVTNSNPHILNRYVELFGGQVRAAEKTPNKQCYHYLITSSEAYEMLKILYPFLDEKKEQAYQASKFHELKSRLSGEEKANMAQIVSDLKKQSHENPELLEEHHG